MLKNYLNTAFRNLIRNKFYSLINIIGLAGGLSCFLLIYVYISDELSYDKFNTKHDRIYRVVGKLELDGQGERSSSCPFPLGPALKNDYSNLIEHSVRFFNFQDPQHTLKFEEKKINETGIFLADSNVFEVFDYVFIEGNSATALAQPNSIVMTADLAKKYFGTDNPIGKVLKFDGIVDVMVTAIIKNPPSQSHIYFDALISFSTIKQMLGSNQSRNWVWNPNWTYVLLKENVSEQELQNQLPAFVQKYYPDFLKPQVSHNLQKLADIHLTSKLDYEIEPNGDKTTLYIFGAIGIFILIIASINFMNLATARSANRAKEVGIRKSVGANKNQLIVQFILESVILSLIAVVIALAFTEFVFPLFNAISGKNLDFRLLQNIHLIGVIIAIGIATGVFSGIYPAFYLSSFEPIAVLKGRFVSGKSDTFLRKILVVIQFVISIVLIISTIVIYKQLNHLKNVHLGFDKEQVLILPVRPPMAKMFESLKTELSANKYVKSVASMNDIIGKKHNTHEYNFEGMKKGDWIYYPTLLVSETFVETMNMELIAGRNFSKQFIRDDSLSVIINEEMLKHLGLTNPEDALGKQFFTPTGSERVIGVVKNFNYVSLLYPVAPFVLDIPHNRDRNYWTRYFVVRLEKNNVKKAINDIKSIWENLSKEFPFEYFFLDDNLNKQYKSQYDLAKLITYFSILAIFIACLGLFALSSFTAEQRTKEIGIRKVMGANTVSIIKLLSKDFLKLVFIANLIAWPLSYYLLFNWLNNFAYRTTITLMPFVLASVLALLIAFITVLYQAYKAAVSNPIKALKYE